MPWTFMYSLYSRIGRFKNALQAIICRRTRKERGECSRRGHLLVGYMNVFNAAIPRRLLFFSFLFSYGALPINAQTQVSSGAGSYADQQNPLAAQQLINPASIWSVDHATGALHVKIALPTTPSGGRGPKVPFIFQYDSGSTITLSAPVPETTAGSPTVWAFSWVSQSTDRSNSPGPKGPWTTTFGPGTYITKSSLVYTGNLPPGAPYQNPTTCSYDGPFLYADADGVIHDLNLATQWVTQQGDLSCPQSETVTTSSTALDGSAISGQITGFSQGNGLGPGSEGTLSIVYPDGSSPGEDTNGNEIVYGTDPSGMASIMDSTGRYIASSSFGTGSNTVMKGTYSLTTKGQGGSAQNYNVTAVTISPTWGFTLPHPASGEANVIGYSGSSTISSNLGTLDVITSITLPDQTAFSFAYDPVYGTINKISFPQGGYVRFVWGVRGVGVSSQGLHTEITKQSTLVVTDVYVSDGVNPEIHLSYLNPDMDPSTGALATTENDPDATTVYTSMPFQQDNVFAQSISHYHETERQISDPSGNLMETVVTTYGSLAPQGKPSQVVTTYWDSNPSIQKQVTFSYDQYENVTEMDESGFYPCSTAAACSTSIPWLRETSYTYSWAYKSDHLAAHIVNKPWTITIKDGSGNPMAATQYSYDDFALSGSSGILNHDTTYSTAKQSGRGNLTTEQHCVTFTGSSCAQWVTTTYKYDLAGQMVSKTDPNGNLTKYFYTDQYPGANPSQPTDSYLTQIINAKNFSESYTYDYYSGKELSQTDVNNITTNYSFIDPLSRITKIQYAAGKPEESWSVFSYPTPNLAIAKSDETSVGDGVRVSSVARDGLGRVITQTSPNGAIIKTTYDTAGNVSSISNPYFTLSDPTYGITAFTYDALGRKLLQCQPDNGTPSNACAPGSSYLQWHYSGNVTDRYDEARVHWRDTSDSLGRLQQVMELGTVANPLSLETDYVYDALNNLQSVNQHGTNGEAARTRSFTYDAMSRLVTATNPESGTICYGLHGPPSGCVNGYDANGNLLVKISGSGIVFYNYDALNRLTSKQYQDGTPTVNYHYDEPSVGWSTYALTNTIGRLSSASVGGANPSIEYSYAYDAMGRPTTKYYLMPNLAGTAGQPNGGATGNNYDLAGNVTFTSMGPGIYLYQARDAAGRVTGVTSNKATTNPLSGVVSGVVFANATYTPFGALSSRQMGNGLTETRNYDTRERVTSISQAMPGSTVSYSSSVQQYAPNGNVLIANDSVNGNWVYGYDSLNRLTGASSSSGLNLSWGYDSFGNRWSQTASGSGSAPQPSFTFNGNNNQTDASNGLTYDGAGDVLVDNLNHAYTYDAEGRMTSATLSTGGTATYQYDSDGQLVYETGGSGSQIFVRDAAGHPVFVYAPAGSTGPYYNFMAYIDGELIGSWENQTFFWAGKDWLGTKRYESSGQGDINSTVIPVYRNAYTSLPFGDALSSIGFDPLHFTGKERDTESGLDYFGARYYASTMGRFMSPDPLGGHLEDPQTLNKYSYVANNPLTRTDPTGLDFNLQCTQTKDNASTCQGGVQGTTATDADGKSTFTATRISSDDKGNLTDQNGNKYSGTFDGKNVSFAGADGSKSTGSWIQGSNDTKGITGGGDLSSKFNFTFSDHGDGQRLNASFTYSGSISDAASELQKAGFQHWNAGFDIGYSEWRLPAAGRDSSHFNIWDPNFLERGVMITPKDAVPGTTSGNMHAGEYYPGVQHTKCDVMGLC